jgi:hypothetical protein
MDLTLFGCNECKLKGRLTIVNHQMINYLLHKGSCNKTPFEVINYGEYNTVYQLNYDLFEADQVC